MRPVASPMQVLTALIVEGDLVAETRPEWRRQLGALLWILAVTASLLALWSMNAPLSGAVVAPAQVRAEYRRKTVQHQDGGIVREVLVRDGQAVHAGDPLLVIGDLRQDAELKVLRDRLLAMKARAARAEAETRLATRFEVPSELDADADAIEHIARERAVFTARRRALDEQVSLLGVQLAQARAQVSSLESQAEATIASGKLSEEELVINEGLAVQGFVSGARMLGLKRAVADYRGRAGEVGGELALARQRVAELRGRLAQLPLAQQTQASDELKDAAAQLRELDAHLRPLTDQVARQVVRSPVDGDVMSLRVTGPGAVIAPRESLLDVMPRREKLVIDARIEPQDIEHVRVGGAADVRLVSADARSAPMLSARVASVSADRVTQPETGRSWFDITVEVTADDLDKQRPAQHLQAGMAAEVFVRTGERTLVEYLLKPLRTFSRRAMREPG